MKIGIIETGRPPESLKAHGDYPAQFARLLDGHGFDFAAWAALDGELPDSHEAADGWLITGSKHGAYEDHAWIPPLEALIRRIDAAKKPLVGICFGHQIIAQALGGKVEKFEGGWSVGARDYAFADRNYRLAAWHQDQVTQPPARARTIASSDLCAHAALAYDGHIFTVQPHPEFGHDFLAGLIRDRGPGVVPGPVLDAARASLDGPIDQAAMGDLMARFLKGQALL